MSEKFIDKFIGDVFVNVSNRGFFRTIFTYMIDSRERTRKKLSVFLKDQLYNPDKELKRLAAIFLTNYKNPDERIIEILKFVHKEIKYVSDKVNFGKVEYWATAKEIWNRKRGGDCDDINGLIYHLAMLSGISSFQLWSAIGSVWTPKGSGGHYFLFYFSFKTDKWYVIDGTYYVDRRPVNLRPVFELTDNRYKEIWYVFSELYTLKAR